MIILERDPRPSGLTPSRRLPTRSSRRSCGCSTRPSTEVRSEPRPLEAMHAYLVCCGLRKLSNDPSSPQIVLPQIGDDSL